MRDVSLSAQKFDDFPEDRAAPRRRGPGSAPAPARAKKKAPRGGMFQKRRLGAMALIGIGGLALVGVPLNALYFQEGRHPAPLFSTHLPPPDKSEPAAAPTPPARPAKIETAREAEAVKAEPAPRAAPPKAKAESFRSDPVADILKSETAPPAKVEKAEKAEKKREVASRDQIGALLGAGAPKAAPVAPGPDRGVLATQQALQRLGYVVKPDGLKSAALRKTVEQFERDHGLPVTGELSAKVAKAITARAVAGR